MRKYRELTAKEVEARRKFLKNEKRDATAGWGGVGFIIAVWAALVCSHFDVPHIAILAGIITLVWGFIFCMSAWSIRVAEDVGKELDR